MAENQVTFDAAEKPDAHPITLAMAEAARLNIDASGWLASTVFPGDDNEPLVLFRHVDGGRVVMPARDGGALLAGMTAEQVHDPALSSATWSKLCDSPARFDDEAIHTRAGVSLAALEIVAAAAQAYPLPEDVAAVLDSHPAAFRAAKEVLLKDPTDTTGASVAARQLLRQHSDASRKVQRGLERRTRIGRRSDKRARPKRH